MNTVEDRVMQLLPNSYCYALPMQKDEFGLPQEIHLFIALPYKKIRRFFDLGDIDSFGEDSINRVEDITRLVFIRLIIEVFKRLKVKPEILDKKKESSAFAVKQLEFRFKGMKYAKGLNLRFRVLQRDGFRCRYCGRDTRETVLQIDHIQPKSKSGETVFNNLITACRECNLGKHDVIFEELINLENKKGIKSANTLLSIKQGELSGL